MFHQNGNDLEIREIEAAAYILANIHDIPVLDLESEFRRTMLESFPESDQALLKRVYDEFVSVDPEIRFDKNFDHIGFVVKAYRLFLK